MKTLKTFYVELPDYFGRGRPLTGNYASTSAAKARYEFWYKNISDDVPYSKCFKQIKSRSLGAVKPAHFYDHSAAARHSFENMKKHRGIEFCHLGMAVDVCGQKGWITGSNSSMNLDVLMEGTSHTENCHPHWQTTYYDNQGNVIKDFKTKIKEA